MSYLVFARKYRPNNFDEVVDQEHVTTTLKNAIKTNRLGHAFLFAGPRGIGKTSCARILAKSLNCQNGPTLNPCNICDSCREISESRSMDVIEIDGASNRGIDEVRVLRENVKFATNKARFKIYIIDEVHMLTPEAFNALLKTLEEPPAHVKFIFATTAPHKVLPTILSRCQRFDFRRISVLKIMQKLEEIARDEKLSVDKDVLLVIAKAASGSLRDAESILDQLSAFSKEKISLSIVTSMLGMVEEEFILGFTNCILKKDSVTAFKLMDSLINEGKDINQFILSLVEHFRNLMIAKVGGKVLDELLDLPDELKEQILKQSEGFSLKEILNAIELFVCAQEMSRYLDSIRIPLEMAVAQLSYAPKEINPQLKNESLGKKESVSENPSPKKEDDNAVNNFDLQSVNHIWDESLHKISKVKMSVATFLQEGRPIKLRNNTIVIGFPKDSSFHKETLERKENRSIIEKMLKELLSFEVKVEFEITQEEKNSTVEPVVQSALDAFKGKVINKWHQAK
ncbi:MAG: DNA polymerase III subunit gamma/tau [Candidatus Omnitrophota bacterium]|nr:DNA polymerase III subunit gamma/tau [Candidatus Omnitrophota bacterium]